ncbi:MAG TPA: ribosome maturation factor RimM [Actinomycetota bacterium]|nr:ribosome maturation factor RimM [Actinomycetota bacterium]
MNEPPQGLLIAGEIGKPHGTAGEVYVIRVSDDPRRFEPGSRLLHSDGREMTVEKSRNHRDRLLIKFEGSDSREEAEGLRGTLYVHADDRRELDPGEYWAGEVIGCVVVLQDGTTVGEIRDVIPGSAHDLLSVHTSNGNRLIPVVKELVVSVDVPGRRVVIDPPDGLLD